MLTVLVRIHPRRSCWRVAMLYPGGIRWRAYRRTDCPTAADAERRAVSGLASALEEAEMPQKMDDDEGDGDEKQNHSRHRQRARPERLEKEIELLHVDHLSSPPVGMPAAEDAPEPAPEEGAPAATHGRPPSARREGPHPAQARRIRVLSWGWLL